MKFFKRIFKKLSKKLSKKILAYQAKKIKPCGFHFDDTMSGSNARMQKFFEENPFTWEMLEELRKGNPVRVDAGRKKSQHSS